MKVDSRVEALEHELKILKNEIQTTLLEIREQVLNHYYPELRASEPPPRAKTAAPKLNEQKTGGGRTDGVQPRSSTKSNPRAQANSTSASAPRPQVQPFSDVFLQDMGLSADDIEDIELDDDDLDVDLDVDLDNEVDGYHMHADGLDDDIYGAQMDDLDDENSDDAIRPTPRPTAATPKMREVNFQQLKQTGTPRAVNKVSPNRTSPDQGVAPAAKPTRNNFGALAAWVTTAIAKVGKERTLQVVETYASSGGALGEATKKSMLQIISLANDEAPTAPVGNQEMLGLMVELDTILGV